MRAVVFVNGKVDDYADLERWLRAGDILIGADGGTLHILALDRLPHFVVGDLDSLPPTVITTLTGQGIPIERHPVTKDQTDLELAIERALDEHADEILLLSAVGGRLDQTLANLLILAQREWPVPISLAEGNQVAQILRGGERLEIEGTVGATVSVIPLSPQVTGISYSGLTYPLQNATLTLGSTRGVSNSLADPSATVEIETGLLLVVCTIDRGNP